MSFLPLFIGIVTNVTSVDNNHEGRVSFRGRGAFALPPLGASDKRPVKIVGWPRETNLIQ